MAFSWHFHGILSFFSINSVVTYAIFNMLQLHNGLTYKLRNKLLKIMSQKFLTFQKENNAEVSC